MSIGHDQGAKALDMQFTEADLKGVQFPYEDPLVVSLEIARYEVKRILVDGGSSADILFLYFQEYGS